jgi:hypothetical protein
MLKRSVRTFSNTVDSNVIMQQAGTLVSSGMKEVGHQYVNIDGGWWLEKRDPSSNIAEAALCAST